MAVFRIDRFRPSPAAAEALRAHLAPLLRLRSARAIDPRLIKAVEIALTAATGVVLASMAWNIIGPITSPSTAPRAAPAPVESAAPGPIDPFRMASDEVAPLADELGAGPDLAETTLNLALHGTWITDEGGAAFIKTPDEKQGRYSIGDTITNGVTLEKVFRDQVVINRGGARESLRLINRESRTPSGGARPRPQENKIDSDVSGLASIGDLIIAEPELDDVGNVRLILQPASDEEAFEDLGLRAGDALVAVDNKPIGADVAAGLQLIANIKGRPTVTISVERDGVVLPVTVALPGAENSE